MCSTRTGPRKTSRALGASSMTSARPRTFSPHSPEEWQRLGAHRRRPIRRRLRSIASAIAKASAPAARRGRGRCAHALSRCWPTSAAPSSSARPRELDPGTFYDPGRANELGAAASVARAVCWWHGSRPRIRRPAPVAGAASGRRSPSWPRRRSGALGFNLGVTLARVAVAFTIAMALGTISAS